MLSKKLSKKHVVQKTVHHHGDIIIAPEGHPVFSLGYGDTMNAHVAQSIQNADQLIHEVLPNIVFSWPIKPTFRGSGT